MYLASQTLKIENRTKEFEKWKIHFKVEGPERCKEHEVVHFFH